MKIISSGNLHQITELKHGYCTRIGGVSKGDFAGANFGYKTGDNIDDVRTNYEILAKQENFKLENLIIPEQTHSNNVKLVKTANDNLADTDAVITNQPDLILAILTADCCPILLCDENTKFIAAIHAGWRSSFNKIISNTVNLLVENGVKASNIKAAIFPTISHLSYEVDPDFRERFIADNKHNQIFFSKSELENKFLFDLVAYNIKQIKDSGITDIFLSDYDTYSEPQKFYSYRYACKQNKKTGRNLTFIGYEKCKNQL